MEKKERSLGCMVPRSAFRPRNLTDELELARRRQARGDGLQIAGSFTKRLFSKNNEILEFRPKEKR